MMNVPEDQNESDRRNARIVAYWRRHSEESPKPPAEPIETQFRALTEEVDSARDFHPDQRKSLETLGRFVEKNRDRIGSSTKAKNFDADPPGIARPVS
jgi:hypothetical protein